ncbi:TetR/AcrR family transcriptional regulator [Amycolatopsis taiwanensis]|uniref:TetR family transcriptional regulator n=1 Tax=Amycolatopsis taiwanensis TaxID=342230 RepID=A0A9W6R7C5_9PSEU|nr:TetR/AcrR family transcriptional regulator [Amycolatopsis taiwanensis]GLY70123.1 TetR family transcriptional regulator [Amycolatopsis taiwanensis]
MSAHEPVPASGKPVRADAQRNRARILAAAEAVFAEGGPSASTEEVARRAGVAIGTVFRHFPTKKDLLAAIVKELMERLTAEVNSLVEVGDPATAFFEFFTRVVEQAAAKKSVVDLLAQAGVDLDVAKPVNALRQAIGALLAGAQRAGAVRDDVQLAEVMALLTATSQAALRSGWSRKLQHRALAVIYAGLRSAK